MGKHRFKIRLPKIDLSHLGKDIQKAFKQLDSHIFLKFEPATTLSRNATLLVTKLNLFNVAERMDQAIKKGGWKDLEKFWSSIGGNPKKFELAIQMGKKVHDKHHHKFEGWEGFEQYEGNDFDEAFNSYVGLADNDGGATAATAATVASVPTIMKILDIIKKLGIKVDDVKGLFGKKAQSEIQKTIADKITANPEKALAELQSGEPNYNVSDSTAKEINNSVKDVHSAVKGGDLRETVHDNKNIMLAGAAAVLIVVILATRKK